MNWRSCLQGLLDSSTCFERASWCLLGWLVMAFCKVGLIPRGLSDGFEVRILGLVDVYFLKFLASVGWCGV